MTTEPVPVDVTSLRGRRAVNRWERMSVGDILERLTWSYPDKEAVVGWPGAFADPQHRRLTYHQADRLANRFANALLAEGLSNGDMVAMLCENSVEAYVAKIAVAKAGLVCVPINPNLAPDVVCYVLAQTEPRLVVVDAEVWPRVEAPLTALGLQPRVTIPIGGDAVPGSTTFTEFVAEAEGTEPETEIHADDIWEILYTSGTTAMPKGVMLSHTYSYTCALGYTVSMTRGLRLESEMRLCTFLPVIYHIGDHGFTLPAFFAGGTLIIGRRHDIPEVAAAVTQERVTALWGGAAPFLDALVSEASDDTRAHDLTSLTVLAYAWSAIPPPTADALLGLCGRQLTLLGLFGQTESMSAFRFWPARWPETYARTAPEVNYVGVPGPMLASVVTDEAGVSLRDTPGVTGEAVYRSPAVTAGYYRDEEATRTAFRHGWFHSGDACTYDDDGLVIMVDRFKDVVKSGGENVSSLRVEAVLAGHPDVAQVAVVGLPHVRWGEAVTAMVVMRPGRSVTEDDLIAFCRSRLAGFETPKRVVVLDSLPVSIGSKIKKYELRARFAELYAAEGVPTTTGAEA
ncbi:acyl-CoA synthetase [Actinomycetospora sp. NBRC 106375]|uniref:AMP-binding protein n=1 Tax=Actinomycetospora sp. NBRC 106375 TaxID=3032207 RepID=UPI0024A23410|nr:AMP-binding protein [Actinomycetospora sp. NBRC 106375]GLZ50236.1 acyl-CoA synthetase [Actinomycetospora sp. NBRC 106375]